VDQQAGDSETGRQHLVSVKDGLVAAAYTVGWRAVRAMPHEVAARLFRFAADRATARRGPGVVQYARNMRRVLGNEASPESLHAVTAAGMRSYARYWLETFRLPSMDLADVAQRAVNGTTGMENLDAAVESGRGAVLALPHSGNWDVAGLMVCRRFGGLVTVAERLKPESVYNKFVAYRESLGMEVLPLTGGAVPTSQVLQDRLRAGKIICLLGDRDLTSRGVPVDFFGERTRMPAGPAMLAALTGADLLRVHLTYTNTGWHHLICPPLQLPGERLAQQVRQGTQLLADGYASGIVAEPADWHMLQPLWEADLPADRRASLGDGTPQDRTRRRDKVPQDEAEPAEAQP
jgi:KDO2-lipid IV(A) lauroyltransferase